MKNLKYNLLNKTNTFSYLVNTYKSSGFYIKSLQIKTDYSRYKKHFRHFHPKHFDVDRTHSKYVREIRDYKDLSFFTKDPLHFDYHLDELLGSLEDQIDEIKESKALSYLSNSLVSPYKVINLMYNMVISNHKDMEFLKQIESTINIHTVIQEELHPRYPFAYLYVAFKTGIFREECYNFFENQLEVSGILVHSRWMFSLLDAAIDSKYCSEEKLNKLLILAEDVIVENFNKEIKDNMLNFVNLANILNKQKIQNKNIWNLFLNEVFEFKFNIDLIKSGGGAKEDKVDFMAKKDENKISTKKTKIPFIEHTHAILNAINTNVRNPKFHRYEDVKIINTLNHWKEAIEADIHKSYIYNTKELRFNTIYELIAKRNEITPETHILESYEKEEEAESLTKKVKTVVINEKEVYNYYLSLIDPKVPLLKIRSDVLKKFPKANDYISKIDQEMKELHQKRYIDGLIKENKLNSLFEDKPDAKEGASASAIPTGAADTKKDAGKGKKKK